MILQNLLTCVIVIMSCLGGMCDIGNLRVNEIQEQFSTELTSTNLTLDSAKALLKNKCIEVNGQEKGQQVFEKIESSTLKLGKCISEIVNITAIQSEIEKASPQGELDVVFSKYCRKRPEALNCIEEFNTDLLPCLDEDEQQNQNVFMRIVRSLLNFVCHKGGDQIALFIAEKGPECLETKKEDIQQCVNKTISNYIPNNGIGSINNLPKFIMGPKQCGHLENLESCILEKLESCQEITPANIVESMFRFIKNETICRTHNSFNIAKDARRSAARSVLSSVLLCLIGFVIILFAK